MDDLTRQQMELVKNANPEQRAQIRTQHAVLSGQIKQKIPLELPIDQNAEEEARRRKTDPSAKKPQGGRKSRRKSKTSRKTRRGGFSDGAIPYGKRCVFPDSSVRSETRTFAARETVCYRGAVDPTPKSAYYISTPSPQAHMVEPTVRSEPPTLVPWFMVGKLVDNAGTGAAEQGMGTGTVTGPLLARSSGGRRRR